MCVVVSRAHLQRSRKSGSSPGARGGTAGAAARSGSAQKCWRWPAKNPADGDGRLAGPDRARGTWQSCLPPSRQGPCQGCQGCDGAKCMSCDLVYVSRSCVFSVFNGAERCGEVRCGAERCGAASTERSDEAARGKHQRDPKVFTIQQTCHYLRPFWGVTP